MTQATTIGALRETAYRPKSVKAELRGNLISALSGKKELFKGIVGYETTVIPQIENAVLSGQDIIFLGERGQAKTRIARQLIELLDATVPAIAGCEINDDPFAPICASCKYRVANDGDSVEIVWLTPEQRYSEKLATPDISIADLIGEVDPIKVAEGRYLSDEMTIHYGLVPRTHRGIFTLNELPDLAERVQVGLLNVMEERDVQIRGYKVRLPLDLFVVASANPEDYTNRGRIITPLKDRFGSQIRTHYPKEIAAEVGIMEQERQVFVDEGITTMMPAYMKEVLAEISQLARRSPEISQRSGVSVRVTVANYENLASAALKRTGRWLATTMPFSLRPPCASSNGRTARERLRGTARCWTGSVPGYSASASRPRLCAVPADPWFPERLSGTKTRISFTRAANRAPVSHRANPKRDLNRSCDGSAL
jgi:magnesium chelatase subunit I